MKILITGANGFIGSYVSQYLLQKGYSILNAKRKSTNKLDIELDVLNETHLQNVTIEADVLIHTATANDIVSKNTLNGFELSGIGTKNMLEFALKNKIKKVIVFSTLQVYGSELSGDINENSALNFQNDYALNHVIAEMYAQKYARETNLQCVAVRPSNVFGKIMDSSFNRWSLVPGCFCKEALESNSITIKSSGLQKRDFVSLENIAIAMDCLLQNFPTAYQCFNIAQSQTLSMLDVAKIVQKVFKTKFEKEIKINVEGTLPLQSNNFYVCTNKLKNIGYLPSLAITLESEIEHIINYLKNN
jgi:UDP-glucose 4-epimerase